MLNNKKQLICNLYGGPGSGKSSLCYHLTAELKWLGINCEMAPEYAKVKVWEKANEILKDQLYVFGKQYHSINKLRDQVSIILTDSPLLLSVHYDRTPSQELYRLVIEKYKQFDNIDIFVDRVKPYNPAGREQTEPEAKAMDSQIKSLLEAWSENWIEVPGERDSVEKVLNHVLNHLKSE